MGLIFKIVIFVVLVVAALGFLGYKVVFDVDLSLDKKEQDSAVDNQGSETDQPVAGTDIVEGESEDDKDDDSEYTGTCEFTEECPTGLSCIEGICGKVAELFETDCLEKCTITGVKLTTSDDEVHELSLGQGSYSMAGALDWKLLTTPQYCSGSEYVVPIRFSSRSGGEIVGEQIVTLIKGETSQPVSHALADVPTFTITMDEVTEECS